MLYPKTRGTIILSLILSELIESLLRVSITFNLRDGEERQICQNFGDSGFSNRMRSICVYRT